MFPLKHTPPPPNGDTRPLNDLRPGNENLIQPYFSRESNEVWIYIPESVKRSAVCNNLVDRSDERLYWKAADLRIAVLERIAVLKHENKDKSGMYIIL